MNAEEVRFYREYRKAVEEIERQELRAAAVEQTWKQRNAIMPCTIRLGAIMRR